MKLKLTIPSSLDEINLKQLRDFALLNEKDELKYFRAVANIFCSGDVDQLEKFPIKRLKELFEQLITLIAESKKNLVRHIEIDGVVYSFHPNIEYSNMAEMSDLAEYAKNKWKNIHKMLAVLYRPRVQKVGKLYRIESYNGTASRADLFLEKFPVKAVLGADAFFLTISLQLLKSSEQYLTTEVKKNLQPLHPLIGVGII